jgi:ribosomal protein L11 methyltransferase
MALMTSQGSDRSGWRQFAMDLGALNPDSVEEVFNRHGAQAISFSDAGNNPVLLPGANETPMWPDSRISGLFPTNTDIHSLESDLLSSFELESLPRHCIDEVEDRPWEREWLKDFHAMCFGDRLWVSPDAFDIDSLHAASAVVVRLDPGLAFGTGTHASTALCLRWLDGLELGSLRVLDYGCGSGILAIAALALGARSAVALDDDGQAITATRENARKNGFEDSLFVTQDVAEVTGTFDIVVANILAEPLVQNAGDICDRLAVGGSLALSGILADQVDSVVEAYQHHIEFVSPAMDETTDQIWVRLVGTRI